MVSYKQDKRMAELKAPGGLSKLVLKRFIATEGISELFDFRVEAIGQDQPNLSLADEIGKPVTVTFTTYGDAKRYFVGVLADARHLPSTNEGFGYLLVLRPWLYLLSKRVNSKIYANKNISDIIKDVATFYGQSVDFKLQNTYPPLD
jgi:type VI secretion system secreted protein VgrG